MDPKDAPLFLRMAGAKDVLACTLVSKPFRASLLHSSSAPLWAQIMVSQGIYCMLAGDAHGTDLRMSADYAFSPQSCLRMLAQWLSGRLRCFWLLS
jgi:hypothetical protein